MAYSGTTAASSVQNPPINLVRALGTLINAAGAVIGSTVQPQVGGAGIWYYASTDNSTQQMAAGYFTDGKKLGMRNGDVLLCASATAVGSTTVALAIGMLMTTNSTNGYNLASGTVIAAS